jgi:hypothetical protein
LDRLCCVTNCSYLQEKRIFYLCYGNGKIRTYEEGKVGWRAEAPIKRTLMEVADQVKNRPKESFLLSVSLAQQIFGTPESEFDL